MATSDKLTYLNTTKETLKNVINMSNANITSNTTFRDYVNKLYSGYINILKDQSILIDNLSKGTSSGYISEGLGFPIYQDKMTKLSSQDGTPTPSNPIAINTVKGFANLFNQANPPYFSSDTATYLLINEGIRIINSAKGTSHKVRFRIDTTNINTVGKTIYIKSTIGPQTSSVSYGYIIQASNSPDSITDFVYQSTSNENNISVNISNNYNYIFIALCVNMQISQNANVYTDYKDIYIGFEESNYIPYGSSWIYTTISDGTNSKNISIPLNNNEIVGKGNVLDELIVDKNGDCFINKKFTKIDSYNGETITTDYWSTTGGLDTGATIYYVASSPTLIDLNHNVDLTLYEGANTITNSENMTQAITYIKDSYE